MPAAERTRARSIQSVDRFVLEQSYGAPEAYGVPPGPIPEEIFIKIGKAILTIAAADGELSPIERAFAVGLAKSLGATQQAVDVQRTFDPRGHKLEEYFDASTKPMAKVILYDAVRIARADGFKERERQLAMRGARMLGLDASIVPQIESLLAVEEGVRAARLSVITPPEQWEGVKPASPDVLANDFWRFEQMGHLGLIPLELAVSVGKAILVVASADGELTEKETGWFYGMAKGFGMPQELVEQMMKFDPKGEKLETYLTPPTRMLSRVILYDAVRCAAADGFAQKEREMAHKAAQLLGLDPGIVPWVEGVLMLEKSTRDARIRLLSPA